MRGDRATIRQRAGRALAALAAVAAAWTAIVALAGGVTLGAGAWQLASRDPFRPLLVTVALLVSAAALSGLVQFRSLVGVAAGGRAGLPVRVAVLASAAVMVVSIAWNTRGAGGSDSSCYVLQAQALAQGRATLPPPLAELPPGGTPLVLAPTGFVPSPVPPYAAVPICAAGLAVAMVPAFLAARDAVFFVVPLFAALAVWCTFLLGRAVDDAVAGACAAALLACSPIFLYQAVQPMSDVPATALWLAALVAVTRSPALAGLCASAAVLTRPNLALIVLPLVALLPGIRGWLRFGAASLPLLALLAALNAARYGSPLSSGYGSTDVLFSLAHVAPNLARYPRWLVETHTPFVAVGLLLPLALWRAGRLGLVALVSVALTAGTYLAYTVFDDWWYIRFLLPALPVLLVFSVVTFKSSLAWVVGARGGAAPAIATALLCAALSVWFVQVARARQVFDLLALESRFRLAGYAAQALPAEAIVLAVQQSGSVRYHGGRGTIMWDAIAPGALGTTVGWLRAHGRPAYFALEDGEEPRFRARFAGEPLGGLDWPPRIEIHAPVRVRMYDPEDRVRYLSGGRIETWHIRR